MSLLDLPSLQRATVFHEPFSFLFAPNLLSQAALAAIRADFPPIDRPGLFPLSTLSYGANFALLVHELLGPEIESFLEQALDIELAGRERMVTVRGHCRARDGRIHTDNEDKLAAALLYLNEQWDGAGGRLRLLKSGDDIEDVVAEVPPQAGTLLAFRRSDNSWHGHKPYEGERRYIMVNWMTRKAVAGRELARHTLSARAKSLASWWS